MRAKQVVPGVFKVWFPSLSVNAYLLLSGGEVTLVDTGTPRAGSKLLAALREVGMRPQDVRHLVVTHYHSDHIGSLARMVAESGGTVYAQAADAGVIREGARWPRGQATPGMGKVLNALFGPLVPARSAAAPVNREVGDGEELPAAGGLRAIHTPGHTPGHVSYVWPKEGGVLFAGDIAQNPGGRLAEALTYEDRAAAHDSLRRVAEMGGFEVAVFGHGRPIVGEAPAKLRRFADRLGA